MIRGTTATVFNLTLALKNVTDSKQPPPHPPPHPPSPPLQASETILFTLQPNNTALVDLRSMPFFLFFSIKRWAQFWCDTWCHWAAGSSVFCPKQITLPMNFTHFYVLFFLVSTPSVRAFCALSSCCEKIYRLVTSVIPLSFCLSATREWKQWTLHKDLNSLTTSNTALLKLWQ